MSKYALYEAVTLEPPPIASSKEACIFEVDAPPDDDLAGHTEVGMVIKYSSISALYPPEPISVTSKVSLMYWTGVPPNVSATAATVNTIELVCELPPSFSTSVNVIVSFTA